MDGERIFGYSDGLAEVYADPLVVMGRLIELLNGSPNQVIGERRQTENDMVSELARRKIVVAARDAFALVPFDRFTGEGALDEDAEKVFDDYLRWLDEKKGNGGTEPRFVPDTVPPASLVPGLSPPKPPSDSSSTKTGCGCG